jgi:hypothetical protein
MALGKLVWAVKDEKGRVLELYPVQKEDEFVESIMFDEDKEAIVEFNVVTIKREKRIDFYAEVKPRKEP